MPAAPSTPRGIRRELVAAVLALALLGLAFARHLPAPDQDEFEPVFALSWFTKTPQARSTILNAYTTTMFGHRFPVRCYPYAGAPKAYFYLATLLPRSVPVYRGVNLALLWALVALVLGVCWRVSGNNRVATVACLVFLLTDVPLLVLGTTGDAPRQANIIPAFWLLWLMWSLVERPRWWHLPVIALATFIGEWDRPNFAWFIATALAACGAGALPRGPKATVGRLLVALAGVAIGLYGVARLIPDYLYQARHGMENSLGILDVAALWKHWLQLFPMLSPYTTYHRYANVDAGPGDGIYDAYRWVFMALYLGVIVLGVVLAAIAVRRRRTEDASRFLFVSAALAAILFLLVKTAETWAAHHMIFLKPYLWLGLGVLIGHFFARSRTATAAWVALALLFWAVGLGGFARMQRRPPILGYYDSSWNAVDAWQAAARSPVGTVYALDWGVFYPGVVNSPATQRWEMEAAPDLPALRRLQAANRGLDFGVLFKTSGPHRWILDKEDTSEDYAILEKRLFKTHKGEEWAFAVLGNRRWRSLPPAPPPSDDLVRNGSFLDGQYPWEYVKWESVAGAADLAIEPCDPDRRFACARLVHSAQADSRVLQHVQLSPGTLYEVTATVRTEGVDPAKAGAHLVFLEFGEVQSEHVTGDTGWRTLRFYVANLDPAPHPATLLARLGTHGNTNVGTAWFTRIGMRPVGTPDPGVPIFEIGRGSAGQ